MSKELDAPVDNVIQDAPQDHLDNEPSETDLRASAMGWSPKDKWRGDPDKWVDSDTFVKRGENNIPILNERLRKMETSLREKEEAFEEFKRFQKEVGEQKEQALKSQIAQLRAEKAEAVRSGDGDRVIEIEDAIDSLKSRAVTEKNTEFVSEAQRRVEQESARAAAEWIGKPGNEIFDTDPEVAAEATLQFNQLIKEGVLTPAMAQNNPHLALEMMKRRTKEAMPHKFGNQNRNRPGAVETGGGQASTSGMDEEGRSLLAKFKRTGAIKTPEEEKEFVANYITRYGKKNG